MKIILKNIWLILSAIRLIPHILLMFVHPAREIIKLDLDRWAQEVRLRIKSKKGINLSYVLVFIQLITYRPEYRNVFYYRLGWKSKILYPLCRPNPTFFISKVDEGIGPGFLVLHGWASSVAAKKIGKNFWIFQHVTIGYLNETDKPLIGDNVTIYAGAKVLGNIKIGDNVVVGANAVVTKDVPGNCIVVGVPAYIVRKNGHKVKKPL